jgi:hypothetical protein
VGGAGYSGEPHVRISDFNLPDNSLPNMMIQSTTNNHLSIINNHLAMVNIQKNNHLSIINNHLAFVPLHLSRTLYKSALFMQNKANFLDAQMNISSVLTKDYRKKDDFTVRKNKAKTKPICQRVKLMQSV